MRSKKQIIIIGLIFIVGCLGSSLYAQDDVTPTLAPSKTPTDTPRVVPTAALQPTSMPLQPLTQGDLSILTGNVQRPNGIVWFGGRLFTACNGDFTLYEINDTTGSTRTYIFGVRNAHTLYAEDGGRGNPHLWVPDFETNRLLFIDGAGTPRPVVTDLQGPWGIAYLNESEFLVTNQRGDNLILVNRDGQIREVLSDLRLPTGVAVDDEFVYVANYGRPRRAIEWFSQEEIPALAAAEPEAGDESPAIAPEVLVSGLQNITGVVLAEDGYLYFAYSLGTRGVVGRVNPEICRENGGCTNDQVEIVVYTELASPLAGLTITPDMRLFVHTMFSPDIYWARLG